MSLVGIEGVAAAAVCTAAEGAAHVSARARTRGADTTTQTPSSATSARERADGSGIGGLSGSSMPYLEGVYSAKDRPSAGTSLAKCDPWSSGRGGALQFAP